MPTIFFSFCQYPQSLMDSCFIHIIVFCCRCLSEKRFVLFFFFYAIFVVEYDQPTLWVFLHVKKKASKFAIIYMHPNYCGQGSSISLPIIYKFNESLLHVRYFYNLFFPHIAFRVWLDDTNNRLNYFNTIKKFG